MNLRSRALKDKDLQWNGSSVKEIRKVVPKRTLDLHCDGNNFSNHVDPIQKLRGDQDGDERNDNNSLEAPLSPASTSNTDSTNLKRHLTTGEISDLLDEPDTEQEQDTDTSFDSENKENFPFPETVEEIDLMYPKPPSAPPLTLEIFEAIQDALDKPPKEKIVSGYSLNILQEDLQIFDKRLEWLADRNMDFYLELIKERSKLPGYPSVYIFHSFFYTLLTHEEGDGCEAVKGTTCEDNIFEYDLVFFPVNLNDHWRLVVVTFPEKSMKCYDSMASLESAERRTNRILKAIGKYLKQEYRRKFVTSSSSIENGNVVKEEAKDSCQMFFSGDKWEVEMVPMETIPQQNNAIDCGVFCLQYAEYLSRDAIFDFGQDHVAYFRKRMLYESLSKSLMTSAPVPHISRRRPRAREQIG